MSAISKYHIIDASTGLSIGKHPLVTTAKKAFWQLRPPIPRYRGTYDVTIVLRYIESLGQNADLTLKQLSEKAAFLVAFATLSRYCRLYPSLLSSPLFFFMFSLPPNLFSSE